MDRRVRFCTARRLAFAAADHQATPNAANRADPQTSSPLSEAGPRQVRTACPPFRSTRQSGHVRIPQTSPRRWPPVPRLSSMSGSPLDSRAPAIVLPVRSHELPTVERTCSGGRADMGEEGLALQERSAVSSFRSTCLDVVYWCAGAVLAPAGGVALSLSTACRRERWGWLRQSVRQRGTARGRTAPGPREASGRGRASRRSRR